VFIEGKIGKWWNFLLVRLDEEEMCWKVSWYYEGSDGTRRPVCMYFAKQ